MKELIQIQLVHIPFGVWEPARLEWYFGKNPNPETVMEIVESSKIVNITQVYFEIYVLNLNT